MVTKILLCGLSFSCKRFLLLQCSFLLCLQLAVFCFIVKDFLDTREENIRWDEPSEQELPVPLGRSSVSSKVFPAVEIPGSTLLGIKEYPLGYFCTFPKKCFPKFLGQEYCELSPCVLPSHSLPLAEKRWVCVKLVSSWISYTWCWCCCFCVMSGLF